MKQSLHSAALLLFLLLLITTSQALARFLATKPGLKTPAASSYSFYYYKFISIHFEN